MRMLMAGALALVAVRSAAADPTFGSRGVVELDAGTSLDASYTSVRPPMGASYSTKHIGATAGLSYFVSDGFSVGGELSLGYSSYPSHDNFVGTDISSFAVGPIVGYHVWLRPQLLSLWPRADITYGHSTYSYADATVPSTTYTSFGMSVLAPLVIHPAPHFFFEAGPSFHTDLSAKQTSGGVSSDATKTTSFGLFVAIGGWL